MFCYWVMCHPKPCALKTLCRWLAHQIAGTVKVRLRRFNRVVVGSALTVQKCTGTEVLIAWYIAGVNGQGVGAKLDMHEVLLGTQTACQ